MKYLENIHSNALRNAERTAFVNSDGDTISYGQLWDYSEALSLYIQSKNIPKQQPIIVYGHKDPLMLVCFLASLKSGHAYVPVDMYSVPDNRAKSIAEQVDFHSSILFVAEKNCMHPFPESEQIVTAEQLVEIVNCDGFSDKSNWVSGEDIAYIIFTSGSTGTPKGVQVTANCIDNFCPWALSLGDIDKFGKVFLNQAPFSFDLSVYELIMSLWANGTMFSLTKSAQENMTDMLNALKKSNVNIWISTPSFADMCLINPEFSDLLVAPELFLFCGEKLTNNTARQLRERFIHAICMNTYGPTESTVAVTGLIVTPEMENAKLPIPCGYPREGTRIAIYDEEGKECKAGESGEIVIQGDTVAKGYYKREDLTKKAFGKNNFDGKVVRSYKTGDKGYLDETGCLHFKDRIDLQIKMNGFRIELGDIEENIRALPDISAVVVVPVTRNEKISYLVAHVVSTKERTESDFREGLKIKKALEDSLPHYMIPRKIVFRESLPMTGNGKIDRKQLTNS